MMCDINYAVVCHLGLPVSWYDDKSGAELEFHAMNC